MRSTLPDFRDGSWEISNLAPAHMENCILSAIRPFTGIEVPSSSLVSFSCYSTPYLDLILNTVVVNYRYSIITT